MTAAVLLDHVSAYAAAVRSHLADLSPDQVDDLTDGLEADLAEALEDPRGPVATGEIPIGRPAGSIADAAARSSIIDLTQRFGPAAAYAAELRSSPLAGGVAEFVIALRPLWWVLRGWVIYTLVVLTVALGNGRMDQRFVPRTAAGWVILGGVVLFSVQVGRGLGRHRTWPRRFLAVINLVALLVVLPTLAAFGSAVEQRLAFASSYPVYIQGPAAAAVPENGVFVDGMQVSNLFVFDAAGNPLTEVQVFDDRGRPVRTTYDGGQQPWSLPGVTEPWTFLPSQDEDGRNRWNVYPLSGLPSAQLEYDGITALPQPLDGATPRVPPRPFAKAPAVVTPSGPSVLAPAP